MNSIINNSNSINNYWISYINIQFESNISKDVSYRVLEHQMMSTLSMFLWFPAISVPVMTDRLFLVTAKAASSIK